LIVESGEERIMTAERQLRVVLISFGFKYGMPVDMNYLLDVRFLPNPYWVPELRAWTGRDEEVARYVLESESGREFWCRFESLLSFLLESGAATADKPLRLAIGCTGGRHRSVAVTERLHDFFIARSIPVTVIHRDIERDEVPAAPGTI
jgi:UPF0042 nucleotide-binding protein